MTIVRRYPMRNGREIRIAVLRDHVVVALHDAGAVPRHAVKAISLSSAELDTLRSALADVAGETGPVEATETAQVRPRPIPGESP